MTINDGTDGGGTKGTATIDITSLFGTDDTLKLEFTGTGAPSDKTLTFNSAGGSNTFSGKTLEEQAKSIRDALTADATISQKFEIGGEGTQVTLTAKEEGADKPAVKKITVTDKTAVLGQKDNANSKPGATGLAGGRNQVNFR